MGSVVEITMKTAILISSLTNSVDYDPVLASEKLYKCNPQNGPRK